MVLILVFILIYFILFYFFSFFFRLIYCASVVCHAHLVCNWHLYREAEEEEAKTCDT